MPSAKFIISINSQIIDKPSKTGSKAHFATIWEPQELSPAHLQERVKCGHAFSAQFKSGYRKSTNFLRTNMLAADADGTITIEDALQIPLIRDQASFLYTTSSHTEDTHRFRVVFVIERLITDPHEWANALLGLARKLGTDPAINDAARLFYGNREARFFEVGRTLTKDALEELITLGEDARKLRQRDKNTIIRAGASRVKLAITEKIRLANGELTAFGSLEENQSVHCPFHHDVHASAFTVANRHGQIGLHCKACGLTYWPSGYEDDYDFTLFDRSLKVDHKLEPSSQAAKTLERFLPPRERTEYHQSKYLPRVGYSNGITLIKSPKGTGKTQALEKLLRDIIAGKHADEKIRSILFIGHRQSLIREAAKRLGLRCYLDNDPPPGKIETLAVCLDSLERLTRKQATARGGEKKAFDIVIIDECEQVLSHLIGETIAKNNKLQSTFHALEFQVRNAKAVIGLDADLSLLTTHALQAMRPDDWKQQCRVIYNKPEPSSEKRALEMFKHREPLERDIIDALRRGEKCFVTANSKTDCDRLVEMLRQEFDDKLRIFSITSDNSRDPQAIRFLNNIKIEILNYDVLICSPSLSTGIDISFANNETKIPNVYGFFNRFVSTHTDIDQQISRVRHPRSVKIWISPESPHYSANFDVIRDELGRGQFVPMATLGQRPTGLIEYNKDHPLLLIATHIFAARRASMNRLVELFIKLREANGWNVFWNNAPRGQNSAKLAAETSLREKRTNAILNAAVISDIDYVELDDRRERGDNLTSDEKLCLDRFEMQKLAGENLTTNQISDYLESDLLTKVKMFRRIDLAETSRRLMSEHERKTVSLIQLPDGRLPAADGADMLRVLLRSAGLLTEDGEWNDQPLAHSHMRKFAAVVNDNRLIIEHALKVRARADVDASPVKFLNTLLSRIGLQLDLYRETKVKGKRVRYYVLAGVKRMRDLVRRLHALESPAPETAAA